MKKEKLFTRRYQKEDYTFYAVLPTKEGEKGCLGLELEPYVFVKTPRNSFGYEDTVFLDSNGNPYTAERYLPPWILKDLGGKMRKVQEKIMKDFKGIKEE